MSKKRARLVVPGLRRGLFIRGSRHDADSCPFLQELDVQAGGVGPVIARWEAHGTSVYDVALSGTVVLDGLSGETVLEGLWVTCSCPDGDRQLFQSSRERGQL